MCVSEVGHAPGWLTDDELKYNKLSNMWGAFSTSASKAIRVILT